MNTNLISPNFKIIQGGMGFFVSHWFLAKTVSCLGELGTISGVSLERILATILGRGDPTGDIRRALNTFPYPHVSKLVYDTFFVEEGDTKKKPKMAPFFNVLPSNLLISLTICANYVFVWLAKEDHRNKISINYLVELSMPLMYDIVGAMLAGVDYVTAGAGIPRYIPQVMLDVCDGNVVKYKVPVSGTKITSHTMEFDPEKFFGEKLHDLRVPGFLPIVASSELAKILYKKSPKDSISGFVIEGPTAGGHNAPPRTRIITSKGVELVYGQKDVPNWQEIRDIGLPFWIAGSYASPEKLKEAISLGANGVQIGSAFAFCEESGMDPDSKRECRIKGFGGNDFQVKTDFRFSPTGFPFKVVNLPGTLSDPKIYEARRRICNQGALRSLYEKSDGTIGYRCPAEPVQTYLQKGGKIEDTVERGCLCNGLFSNIGLGERGEPKIVTSGDDVSFMRHLMKDENDTYHARDVINYLKG